MTLLRLDRVAASYGPVQALFGVDLDLSEGAALALMGRNGMGKTTTVRTLCGMMPAGSGQIQFAGQDITRWPAHRIGRAGIGLVPEGRRCFARLSVLENLLVAARPGPWDLPRVHALFPRLAERANQPAPQLSGGEQQMLAIARALMTNPRLLVLDEATEGLAPLVRAEIWQAIAALKRDGLSLIVVDKSLAELRGVADHGVILQRGQTVWAGAMDALEPETATRLLGV